MLSSDLVSTPEVYLTTAAAIVIGLSSFFIFIQIFFIALIKSKCGYEGNFAFTLMSLIGIMDIIQLVNHFISGVFMLRSGGFVSFKSSRLNDTYPSTSGITNLLTMTNIMGGTMTSSWIWMVLLTACLTIHRFIWTIFPLQARSLLSPFILKAFLAFLMLFYFVYLAFNISGLSAMTFSITKLSWYYVEDCRYSQLSASLDGISNYMAAILNTVAYVIMFSYLFCKGDRWIFKNSEVRITLQVFSFSCYECLCFVMWEFISPLWDLTPQLALFNLVSWIIWNGFSAVPYLLFNGSIHSRIRRIFCKKPASVAAAVPARRQSVMYAS